ncbi:proteasome assembly chaperone family protein [Natrononativus amylolyticus]|uniref:proteasome assembly chaperone family protein n=1 Tax=Natrononativus amylolyticus TaxID=2963434 RepID=UPI0020CF4152|nr:PAC2 family protein [Natrononativus amylolyticus]
MSPQASFDVTSARDGDSSVLVLGLSNPGFAGVTATDYLIRHLECEEVGHVAPDGLPSITPFADGEPRNHTRIYDVVDTPLALLIGELFVPVWAAAPFVDAVLEWASKAGIDEIAIPYGVAFPHEADEHAVFSVATETFRRRRLADAGFEGLTGGVLDGVVGDVVARSLNGDAPPTGALVTPTHPPGPDLEAALLLVDAIERLYGVDVDERELREQSEQLAQYYSTLADRMTAMGEGGPEGRDYPEDRTYM